MKYSWMVIFFMLIAQMTNAQTGADVIIGKWLNPDGTKKMEIYKTGSSYFGKLIWIDPGHTNSKAKVGDIILKDFLYSDTKWKGTILAKGDSYSGTLKLNGNVLSITANAGFLSKTKEWKRVSN